MALETQAAAESAPWTRSLLKRSMRYQLYSCGGDSSTHGSRIGETMTQSQALALAPQGIVSGEGTHVGVKI